MNDLTPGLERFVKQLGLSSEQWKLCGCFLRTLRVGSHGTFLCPLEVLGGGPAGDTDLHEAALGLTADEQEEIIAAADSSGGHSPLLRQAMLNVCGLGGYDRMTHDFESEG